MLISVLLVSSFSAPALQNALPVRAVAPWRIEVGPGTVLVDGREIAVSEAIAFDVAPPQTVEVRNEQHATLPVFNPDTGGWRKGARPNALVTVECTATGLLFPESVRVKPAPDGAPFALDTDYAMDPFWGTVGRLEGGVIGADQPVYIDYDYQPCRLDSVYADASGTVNYAAGTPGVGLVLPVDLPEGAVRLANVWVEGRLAELSDDVLFPIEHGTNQAASEPVAERLLPKTLAKLRAGQPVTIVAWGDSVTNGGGVERNEPAWYQHQFHRRLQARFSRAEIRLLTAAWPGGNSNGYMTAPAGGQYDFQRDVIDPKPDLVTIEFVNDAYLKDDALVAHYTDILQRLRGNGSEVILITPHFVRPDWMGVASQKVDADPRPYVQGLRAFAAANDVALADASALWCRLWRQGLPYMTLLSNSINHPDERGHALFADALMGVFPEE